MACLISIHDMNIYGIILGLTSFLCISLFHPIVIKCEYYFSYKIWPVFAVVGAMALIISLTLNNILISSIVGVFGFSCLWSIIELFAQRKRVEKGWFPDNPNRKRSHNKSSI